MPKYEPTRREVYSEMWREFRRQFNDFRDFLSEETEKPLKALKEFGYEAVRDAGALMVAPYVIPTVAVVTREAPKKSLTWAEISGGLVGIIGGLAALYGQAIGYTYLARHDHPEVLAIPVATNVVSGAYEIWRSGYRSARNRIIERHSSDSQ